MLKANAAYVRKQRLVRYGETQPKRVEHMEMDGDYRGRAVEKEEQQTNGEIHAPR